MSTYLYGAEWNINSSLAFGGALAILYKFKIIKCSIVIIISSNILIKNWH